MFAQYRDGVIVGLFNSPQPDAVDADGKVCAGVPTVEIADDHPDVVAFLTPEPQPSREDLVAEFVATLQGAPAELKLAVNQVSAIKER